MPSKLVRVFHFVNREHGLDDIRRRRLKIATIDDLNDPFELLGPSTKDKNLRRRFQIWKTQLAATRGMLCFSRNWKNSVQWSHYADKHRGLCLGFDIPQNLLIPVQYCAKRFEPDIAAFDKPRSKIAQVEMIRMLSTKYSHWRYENEMRLFTMLQDRDDTTGLYFAEFSKKLILKQIIVGCRSTVTRNELAEELDGLVSNVLVQNARLAFQSFAVVQQRDSRLWR
jgi:Protein of unknown function (DUF2971)